MTSRLGIYWSVAHRRPQDYQFFQKLNPSVIKVMDPGIPDIEWIAANLPDSLVVARIHALSEQHAEMLKDPVQTGQRHAEEWWNHSQRLGFDRAKTLVLGVNEPQVWQPGVPEALRLYTIAMCERASQLGLRVGAMQLGVGWPNNTGPDTPPNWSLWEGVENAIRRNNGALVCHDYWADSGPGENWGWWAGRALKCPWAVPIVIGECGVDIYVKDPSVPHASRGWRGRMEPERYARELAEYVGRMSVDSRFVGCCVFASDFASQEWFSFDIEPAYQAILATPIPDVPPTPTPPPIPTGAAFVRATAGANIRAVPITGDVLIAVPYRERVDVLGYDAASRWFRVRWPLQGVERVTGFMSPDLLGVEKPGPVAPPPVPPVPPVKPTPAGDNWARSIAWTLAWEGGLSLNPEDHGNWTGGRKGVGELKGTNFGISAASYPTLDIRNLTKEQAIAIYERDYWQKSGAAQLEWPACLLVFDSSVLHGVGAAQAWLKEVGPDPYSFAAKRLRVYTKLDNWAVFGKSWINRTADLLEAANE